MDLIIERAKARELQEIKEIYAQARTFMAENGNPGQWTGGYPSDELLMNDLEQSQLYVARSAAGTSGIACVFVFFIGLEPSYFTIEGAWKNDAQYGVVHRIATAKWARGRGAAAFCLDWCFRQCGNLRIDTHEDNIPMQQLIRKSGFDECGTVYMNTDGTPRIAFQRTADLILASNSPRRQELMKKLCLPFFVDPAKAEEKLPQGMDIYKASVYLAERKAREVYERYNDEGITVIGSDTVVICDGRIFGKPSDKESAREMLRQLSGRTHEVSTGVSIISKKGIESFTSLTEVELYDLTEKDIEAYIATGEPMDKAGAYGIQDQGALMIRHIRGDYYTVMGFPVAEVNKRLKGCIFC